ncbi:putative reverse transcriptase domain-containing protein [Tanacetum coccineum]
MGRDSNGYVTKLPRTSSGHDTIWVIVDRLTKSAHFLPMRKDYKMDKLARLYLNEIVARHGVPISIISDRDSQFTSRFWKSMQEAYRKPVFDMSTDTTLRPMPNNDNAPKEALYGRKCFVPPMIVGKAGEGTMIVPELVQETTGKISQIKDRLKAAHDSQPSGLHVRFALGASGGSDTVYESTLKSFKKLKRSRIAIVKVRWNSKHGLEFTWEREDQMKLKYPHLFSDSSDEWPVDWMPVSRSLSISFNDHCLKSPMLLKSITVFSDIAVYCLWLPALSVLIEDEEVYLVDGVLEGALGALEALEIEALVDAMDVDNGLHIFLGFLTSARTWFEHRFKVEKCCEDEMKVLQGGDGGTCKVLSDGDVVVRYMVNEGGVSMEALMRQSSINNMNLDVGQIRSTITGAVSWNRSDLGNLLGSEWREVQGNFQEKEFSDYCILFVLSRGGSMSPDTFLPFYFWLWWFLAQNLALVPDPLTFGLCWQLLPELRCYNVLWEAIHQHFQNMNDNTQVIVKISYKVVVESLRGKEIVGESNIGDRVNILEIGGKRCGGSIGACGGIGGSLAQHYMLAYMDHREKVRWLARPKDT